MSEAKILQTTQYRYREDNNGVPFSNEQAWEVLKNVQNGNQFQRCRQIHPRLQNVAKLLGVLMLVLT